MDERILNTKEAAKLLGLQQQTLTNWRHNSRGPDYLKIGRLVKYRMCDLDDFIKKSRVQPEVR